jgi:hypothetical protein
MKTNLLSLNLLHSSIVMSACQREIEELCTWLFHLQFQGRFPHAFELQKDLWFLICAVVCILTNFKLQKLCLPLPQSANCMHANGELKTRSGERSPCMAITPWRENLAFHQVPGNPESLYGNATHFSARLPHTFGILKRMRGCFSPLPPLSTEISVNSR